MKSIEKYYNNIENGIEEKSCGCIILDNDKVLLIEQVDGNWGFPKGHIEPNETEVETAIREVKEETNVDVEIEEGKRYTIEYITNRGKRKQVVFFIAKNISGEIKAQESEINNIKWFGFEDALQKITYDNTKILFKKILEDNKAIKI